MFGQLNDDQLYQLSIGRRLDVASNVYTNDVSSIKWQCGPMETAHDVCGQMIQGVGVDGQAYTLLNKEDQTVGRPGGQCDYCGHH